MPSRQAEAVMRQDVPDECETSLVRPGPERQFTLSQALRTRAFWILAVFSAAGSLVQAGVSLHQVGHYIRQGLSGPSAAIMASVFALAQVPGGLLWSAITDASPCVSSWPSQDYASPWEPWEQPSPALWRGVFCRLLSSAVASGGCTCSSGSPGPITMVANTSGPSVASPCPCKSVARR